MDVRIHGYMDVRVHECTDTWIYRCTDTWMYGCTNIWIHGCTDTWIYGYAENRGVDELKIKYSILENEFLEKSSIIENMKQTQTIGDIPGAMVKKRTTQSTSTCTKTSAPSNPTNNS